MIFCAWMRNQKNVFWMENKYQKVPKEQILDWCGGNEPGGVIHDFKENQPFSKSTSKHASTIT